MSFPLHFLAPLRLLRSDGKVVAFGNDSDGEGSLRGRRRRRRRRRRTMVRDPTRKPM